MPTIATHGSTGTRSKWPSSSAVIPDPRTGWVADFAVLDAAIRPVRDLLDHHYLNDVEGLDQPTLEAISRWIFERLSREMPLLHRVTVRRGSCGEGCSYERPIVTLAEEQSRNR
jgi:6-pyruvoyltetrahydropterin/6-carboxytetrahydropterin synthase